MPPEGSTRPAKSPLVPKKTTPVQPAVTDGRLLIIIAPVLALIGATALMATVAWVMGWYRHEMLIAAVAAGAIVVAVTIALLYAQTREQRAAHRALQRVEARMSGIVESAMDAIITVDESQHVVMFNTAAEAMFGCPQAEAIGAPLAWFIPERFRGTHAAHAASSRAGWARCASSRA
jgi:PAS domain-containing protein